MRPFIRTFAVVSLLGLPAGAFSAPLSFADVFGDSMVLQRDMPVPVWGQASAGAGVTVTFGAQRKEAVADAAGRWEVRLDPMPASAENRALTLSAGGSGEIVLKDVLVGEVWLCSGQSNMEWGVHGSQVAEEATRADDPALRLMRVDKVPSPHPQLHFSGSRWLPCNPANLSAAGTHQGFSAVAYCYGKELRAGLQVPVGVIQSAWGGTRIEPWTPPCGFKAVPALAEITAGLEKADAAYRANVAAHLDAYEAFARAARAALDGGTQPPAPPPALQHPMTDMQQPTMLYNSMVHPLIPYAFRGAIWYQGESNRGEGMLYFEKMKALIGGWRSLWQQGDFPFYFVQLAPFNYNNQPQALPEIWEAQTAAARLIPNTGMAIINDVGNLKDIHPGDKYTVGKRLARLALSRTYGVEFTDDCGPLCKSAAAEDGAIRISFDHAESGLATRDGQAPGHFEIAAAEGGFVPAEAVIDGKTIVVRSAQVPSPARVRFAWDHCAEPNLRNGDGLPASAFRVSVEK